MSNQLDAPPTARVRAKAARRDALLSEAARLFAGRGFDGVSIEDLGSSVGVSGPAVYRHFPSKQAVLAALLVGVSEGLLAGGRTVVSSSDDDASALVGLVRFHVDFALRDPDVIRVQDRDLAALTPQARESVRDLQRRYVDLWVDVLARLSPTADRAELRLRAQATFGLLNSTPHSARAVTPARTRTLLEEMALAALGRTATKP
ncbi:TetR/AcrR family transcriptional regulator [Cellulomonas sp. Leaf334]|uniref:SACE_7040 family transcriptional regulator n=1 Tax=Cellulomonas sp. Leaf334 TaxID=1736339 RepID=UPI0007005E80|nr:TetR/AcrR family transcriptional regulator [Cellulomonas sp. Leaf334]KQR10389.1 TetR family transcriptional regulator [Cellulomonas sp. Leaf334]